MYQVHHICSPERLSYELSYKRMKKSYRKMQKQGEYPSNALSSRTDVLPVGMYSQQTLVEYPALILNYISYVTYNLYDDSFSPPLYSIEMAIATQRKGGQSLCRPGCPNVAPSITCIQLDRTQETHG